MALIPLTTSGDGHTSDRDLPWLNVYSKGKKYDDTMYEIRSISEYDSGLMVCTRFFKSYIHVGSKTHKQLLEALEVFVQMRTATGLMIGKIPAYKELELFVDNERLNHYWHKTENKYVQVLVSDDSDSTEDTDNPFLAGMGVLPVHAPVGESGEGSTQETRRETLAKGKKGGKQG